MYGVVYFAIAIGGTQVDATDASATRLAHWVEVALADAQDLPPLEGVRIVYRTRLIDQGEPGELERLRSDVARHPDHPERFRLAQLENAVAGHPYWSLTTVRYSAANRWRCNFDDSYGLFYDTTLNGGTFWRLGAEQLTIGRPECPPPGFNPGATADEFRSNLDYLLTGGLQLGIRLRLSFSILSGPDSSGKFTVRAADDRGVTVDYHGRWLDDEDRGLIDRVVVENVPEAPEEAGQSWTIEDWHFDGALAAWTATSVEHRGSDDRPLWRLEFVGAELEPLEELDRLLVVPAWDGADPIRGQLTVRAVADYRGDALKSAFVRDGNLDGHLADSPVQQSEGGVVRIWWIIPFALVLVGRHVLRIRRGVRRGAMS